MRKTRGGFKLGRKLVKVFKWVLWRKPNPRRYQRLNHSSCTSKAMSKLCNWGRSLQRGAKGLCFPKSESGYIRAGHDPVDTKSLGVPKGHLAVYVGGSDDEAHRFLVPVVYFNHPLFGELLKEAEKVYGFDHPGGIQIPCRISEFENVKTRIAAGETCRRRRSWKRVHW
ncbi:hypothetical protein L1049_005994 [Liquidambar formosana]|uniref:Uncharacterized protein n=1 Tax=Liquidambar formosana TaxID=63359 RepID=A0AAP0WSL5_LIQFO